MSNNLPASIDPSVLPVERLLPQPSFDATTLVRLVTDSLDPSGVTDTVAQLKSRYAALSLPPNVKRHVDSIFDELASMAHSKEPTVWVINQRHPLATDAKIVRMYHTEGGVEVYSSDGKMFVRTFVPERVIRFFDEAMGEETFVEFIVAAEEDVEEEEEEEEEELEPEPGPGPEPVPTPNPDAPNGSSPTA